MLRYLNTSLLMYEINITFLFLNETVHINNSEIILNETNIMDNRPFVPSDFAACLWTLLFCVIVISAVIGNLLVIWIILRYRKMRTKINIFLLNLSFADLIMATFNAMFNFAYMINSHWPFGDVYCVFSNFVANFAIGLSVFTITATSIDRYIAVVHPLTPRTSKKTSTIIIMFIWLMSILLALPTLLFSNTIAFYYSDGSNRIIYNVIFFVFTYAIPMLSMLVAYSVMSRALWGNRLIVEMTQGQHEAFKSKRKVVIMLITVTVIFGICWLPYHLYFIYIYHNITVSSKPIVQHIYLSFYWLAMSNSSLNPLIYALLNRSLTIYVYSFLKYFKSVLCCIKMKRKNERVRSCNTTGRTMKNTNTETTEYDLNVYTNRPKSNNVPRRNNQL
ncbi:tachykinin-like peptides receptor 86C [Leptotrombidium deliense]|uniref:Tachykinin-like peptides receptor 86C n=1 Tax=Leptotrombidium deliense TaxID=299467 RepID=A0A443S6C5_9ACAR|nr:tachykinin-like peptides receptor 86C [Leptotrombidium deliense]